jgi:DNA-binding PadR family transcriptional regulator
MSVQPSVPPAATSPPELSLPEVPFLEVSLPEVSLPEVSLPDMSLAEWLVLAILSRQSAHGFAVAQLTAADGELGRVWHIPKAVIYRSIGRLLEAALIEAESTETAQGPQRTVYSATPRGREAAARWVHAPVEHVRQLRSHFLLKLALLNRAGESPAVLLAAQRAVLEPIAVAIEASLAASAGFDATLLAWRRAGAVAALDFLDQIAPPEPRSQDQ